MDAAAFRDAVATNRAGELDWLESADLSAAATDDDPTPETVLGAAAASEQAAHRTFSAWAEDEPDDRARASFADAAAQEARHYDLVVAELSTAPDSIADGGPMHAYLRRRDGTVERLAGTVGRSMVSVRTHAQLIDFFADRGMADQADLFEKLERDTRDTLESGLALLEAVCERGDDWERAQATAGYVIRLARDDYADALSGHRS